jgi:hypothetical protein
MTTVAWDGRYLAGDGMSVTDCGTVRTLRAVKIGLWTPSKPPYRKMKHGEVLGEAVIAGTAGVRDEGDEYLDWLAKVGGKTDAAWPFPIGKDEWGTDVLEIRCEVKGLGDGRTYSKPKSIVGRTPRGRITQVGDPDDVSQPVAIGCGHQVAEGAMAYGASAMKAVEIASKLDSHTGGQITYIDTYDLDQGVRIHRRVESE